MAAAPSSIGDLAAASTDGGANLTWTAPADNGSAITAYQVRYSTDGFVANDQLCATSSCTDTTPGASITGLTNNTLYSFRVYAINGDGTSAVSNGPITATPGSKPLGQQHYIWRNDDGDDSQGSWQHASTMNDTDTAVAVIPGDTARLRFGIDSVLSANAPGDGYEAFVLDADNGFIYAGSFQTPGVIRKIRTLDMTVVDTLTLNAEENCIQYNAVIDTVNDFAYFATCNLTPGRIIKIDTNPANAFAVVSRLTLSNDPDIYPGTAFIDVPNQKAYFCMYQFSGCLLRKIDLSTFTEGASVSISNSRGGAIDSTGTYVYIGTNANSIVKVQLSDMTIADTEVVAGTHAFIGRGVVDSTDSFAYFADTFSTPARIYKFNLSTFNVDSYVATSVNYASGAVYDNINQVIYYGSSGGYQKIIRINLGTFTEGTAITTPIVNGNPHGYTYGGLIDPVGQFVYYRTENINRLSRISIANEAAAYQLEYALNPGFCAAATGWTAVPATATSEHWETADSSFITNGQAVNTRFLTSTNDQLVLGQALDTTAISDPLDMRFDLQTTEFEYSIRPTGNATLGGSYCFRLTDAGDASRFGYSTYAQATAANVPDQITNLGTVLGDGQVSLTWTPPANNGSAITGYEVRYSTDYFVANNQLCNLASCTDVTAGAVITGLVNDTTYSFRVFAVNANGTAMRGNFAWATPRATIANPARFIDMSVGSSMTIAVRKDGTVWQWGQGATPTPSQVSGISNAIAVAAGASHKLALLADGTVRAWGFNSSGQLGNGSFVDSATPVTVSVLSGVKAITADGHHSHALKADGTVWSWGINDVGQLGDGTTTNSNTPFQVSGLPVIKAIDAGYSHTLALATDGSVWAWGIDTHGELGDGTAGAGGGLPSQVTAVPVITQISAGNGSSAAVDSDGGVWFWGWNSFLEFGISSMPANVATPIVHPTLTGVRKVIAGYLLTQVVKDDGTLWAAGANGFHALGTYPNTTNQQFFSGVSGLANVVTAGGEFGHSVALLADGTIWSWGYNGQGQMGIGGTNPINFNTPVQIITTGSGTECGITQVAGSNHSIALKCNGTVVTWGLNGNGQLGNGTTTNSSAPVTVSGLTNIISVAASWANSFALRGDGTVWAWGSNLYGTVGDGTTTQRTTPVQVSGLSGVVRIIANGYTAMAITSDGQLWAWGDNAYGGLGINSTTFSSAPVRVHGISNIGYLTDILDAAVGNNGSIALKADGTLLGWGRNVYGELGIGDLSDPLVPVAIGSFSGVTAIDAIQDRTVALKGNGTVWAWGQNSGDVLHVGTASNRISPDQVDDLPLPARAVSSGDAGHLSALLSDGSVWTWGQNDVYGGLGDGTLVDNFVPTQVSGVSNAKFINAGWHAEHVIGGDGQITGWGYNGLGMVGDGTFTDRLSPVSTIACAVAPSAVTDLAGTGGSSSVDLTWSAPANGGAPITAYEVRYSTDNFASDNQLCSDASCYDSTPGAAVPSLTAGTSYAFRVYATNAVGTSPVSNTATVTAGIVPSAISDLAASPGSSQVTLTWTAPADNGSAITAYSVHYSTDGFASDDQTCGDASCTDTTTGAIVAGLTNGTLYTFRAYATNIVGTSSASNDATATPAASGGINASGLLGQYGPGQTADYTKSGTYNAPANDALNSPTQAVLDTERQTLFVVDYQNHRVLAYDLSVDGALLDNTADHVIGQADFATVSATDLSQPLAILVDAAHDRLYVADTGHGRVAIYNLSGGVTDGMTPVVSLTSVFNQPTGLAYDPVADRLFVSDLGNARVYQFDGASSLTGAEAPTKSLGAAVTTAFDTGLSAPYAVAYDRGHDTLFVTDSTANRLLIFDDAAIMSDGAAPTRVLGQTDPDDTTAGASLSQMGGPLGLTYVSASDTLFVSEFALFPSANNRITAFVGVDSLGNGAAAADYVNGFTTAGLLTYDSTSGRLFTMDLVEEKVRSYDVSDGLTNGEPATDVLSGNPFGFSSAAGVVLDEVHHRLFLADYGSGRVLVHDLDANNEVMDYIPDHVLGRTDFTSVSPAGVSQSESPAPTLMAYDQVHDLLYVTNVDNSRVLVYDVASITDGENAIKVLGQSTWTSTDRATSNIRFDLTTGIAYDSIQDRLFVSDINNDRVLVFDDVSMAATFDEPADYVIGQNDADGANAGNLDFFDDAETGLSQSRLDGPYGLAFDGSTGRLYVADSNNHRVLVFDVSGTITNGMDAEFVLGQNDTVGPNAGDSNFFNDNQSGTSQSTFNTPANLSLDTTNGRLLVTDVANQRALIFQVTSITNGESAITVLGQLDFTSSGPHTNQSGFGYPFASAYDSANERFYISDIPNNRIMWFDIPAPAPPPSATRILGQNDGNTNLDFYDDAVAGLSAAVITNPTNIAYDSVNRRVFVAEYSNNRVTVFDVSGGYVNGMAASFVLGQNDGNTNLDFYDDNAVVNPPTASSMTQPGAVWYDQSSSRLFVADTGNHRVLIFDLSGGITNGMAASFVLGQNDANTNLDFYDDNASGSGAQGMSTPFSVHYDGGSQRLFVGDLANSRVLVFDLSGGITNGMAASFVLGQNDGNTNLDFFDDTAPAVAADRLFTPGGVAFDSTNGMLYVHDYYRVVAYDISGGITNGMAASFVLGQETLTATVDAVTQDGLTHFQAGVGLRYDASNQMLYVSDTASNRILAFDVSGGVTDGMNATAVIGQSDFTSNASGTTATSLSWPLGLEIDPDTDSLLVADFMNNRVLGFARLAGVVPPAPVSGGSGPPPQDTTPPVISNLAATSLTTNSATISWDTNEAATTLVRWGLSSAYGSVFSDTGAYVLSHSRMLSDLAENTTYHYQVCSTDSPSNQACSSDRTFTTTSSVVAPVAPPPPPPPPPPEYAGIVPGAPLITNVITSAITESAATVSWTTDSLTTTTFRYGPTSSYGFTLPIDTTARVSHSRSLVGLASATTYHFQICATDSSFRETCTPNLTFSTVSLEPLVPVVPPTPVPVLSGVNAVDITDVSATIVWNTDIPTTSLVRFTSGGLVYQTAPDASLRTSHGKVLQGLASNTQYRYQACSIDTVGRETCASEQMFTTLSPAESVEIVPPAVQVPPPLPEPPAPVVLPPPPVISVPIETVPEIPVVPEPPVINIPLPTPPEQAPPTEVPAAPVLTPSEPSVDLPPANIQASPIISTPENTGSEANLINPSDIEFFTGSPRILLSLDGGTLAVVPGTDLIIHLPDIAIRKPMTGVTVSVGSVTYEMSPTGSFTGSFVAPTSYGDHAMNLVAQYADGSYDSVPMKLSVRAPGTVYETMGGTPTTVTSVRVTLLSADGAVLDIKESSSGDYAFMVSAGIYKVQISKDGYSLRTTLPMPATSMVAAPIEIVRLPDEAPLAEVVYVAKLAYVETRDFVQNPIVEEVAKNTSGYILTAGVVNTAAAGAAAGTGIPYLTYLLSLMAHPTQMLARRARRKWGVVYNALTKLPIDLAIVRLTDVKTGRIVRSSVTDKQGRYFFIVPAGAYKLTAIKAGFVFPAPTLAGQISDTAFLDLNNGENFEVDESGVVAYNLPAEPGISQKTPGNIVADGIMRRTQNAVGVAAIAILALATFITPSMQMFAILAANAVSYAIFRRMSTQSVPKEWGKIEDAETGAPIRNAVARIFDMKFDKLLETQVTDFSGRYGFLVGKNAYYVTFEKQGYVKEKKGPFDFVKSESSEESVAVDVTLSKDSTTRTI